MKRFTIAAILLLALAATPALADEGRIPVYGQTTIRTPGHYIVTRDFSYASGAGIVIDADDVNLDLNGRTITGPACGTTETAIRILTNSATQSVVIRNGRLLYGCSGIVSETTNRTRVRIEGVEVAGTAVSAIVIGAAVAAEVLRCHVHDIPGFGNGIGVYGSTGAFTGRVSDNVVERIGKDGIILDGMAAGQVRRNVVMDYGLFGGLRNGIILFAGSLAWGAGSNVVEGNTIRAKQNDTECDGIRMNDTSPSNVIENNVVTGAGRIGILSDADGTRLERNVVSGNGVHGIQIGLVSASTASYNHMEGNQAQANKINPAGCGIAIQNGNGHVFRNNNLRDNAVAGVCGGTLGTNTDGGGNIQ